MGLFSSDPLLCAITHLSVNEHISCRKGATAPESSHCCVVPEQCERCRLRTGAARLAPVSSQHTNTVVKLRNETDYKSTLCYVNDYASRPANAIIAVLTLSEISESATMSAVSNCFPRSATVIEASGTIFPDIVVTISVRAA